MKTTVDLPDELLTAAKKRAAELRVPLRELLEKGLRSQLQESDRPRLRRRKIRWVIVDGGLPRGWNVSDREAMHEKLRRDR